jgi:prepilin-type N-terminal cleavage/methylation domain-containing protein
MVGHAVHRRSTSRRALAGAGRRGFSLLELLMIIVIVGILSRIALPRLNNESFKVSSAVQGVTASLSYAQRLAVTLQHDVRVAFDVPNQRLRVHEDRDNDGVIDANERVTYTNLADGVVFAKGAAPTITYSTAVTGPATINFTRLQGALPVIIFRRDGSASENGGFYLNTRKAVALGSTGQARAAEIVRATGRVLWYTYGSGVWRRGN